MNETLLTPVIIGAIMFCVLWSSCGIACNWTRNSKPLVIAFLTTMLMTSCACVLFLIHYFGE